MRLNLRIVDVHWYRQQKTLVIGSLKEMQNVGW